MSEWFGELVEVRRIWWGSFSIVYECREKGTDKPVCLKIENTTELVTSLSKHEYTVAKMFEGNPHIVQLYKYYEMPLYHGISMEMLGRSLGFVRRIRANPPPLHLFLNIAYQCACCLVTVHSKGVVHSDVKPSNFVLRADTVVLIDFGLAGYSGESQDVHKFRMSCKRNHRYLSNACSETKNYTAHDDMVSLLYTLTDFYYHSLPWDGIFTREAIEQKKIENPLETILPRELLFMMDAIEDEDTLLFRIEEEMRKYPEDRASEIEYLEGPADPGHPEKVTLTANETTHRTNQHSA